MDRKIPVLFKEKKECCGCTACYAICSQMAMAQDYPVLVSEKNVVGVPHAMQFVLKWQFQ